MMTNTQVFWMSQSTSTQLMSVQDEPSYQFTFRLIHVPLHHPLSTFGPMHQFHENISHEYMPRLVIGQSLHELLIPVAAPSRPDASWLIVARASFYKFLAL